MDLIIPEILADADAAHMALTFKGLSDLTRLKILSVLLHGEIRVSDLAERVQSSQSAVSHQLRVLRDLGFVSSRREGQQIFYRIDDEHIEDLFQKAFAHSRHLSERRKAA
ncbi:MAG: winged helix-turn-helix transcriptional regulator [Chloroflexi bacterium]|nr:winged helix-turn-helix transcriptional regulator [Anaerolineaceae bacterium]NLI45373.1 winged helix-turn-helix transcriptional regulator [Chloroflexota bacterium]HOE35327.1 metalloregulator ArsR/SmtB family transcription factor [Anaerolineaceae bacterium]HOT26384.1 metalloregulator ArsR/SmtB family transcription factor [Anaerolineaceae bacterium]HQH58166.1 metalloregulator ArsR/SmtB family transcription factor [Anaerolineaceae bacterium]